MRVNANAVLRSWTLLAAFGGSYAPDRYYAIIIILLCLSTATVPVQSHGSYAPDRYYAIIIILLCLSTATVPVQSHGPPHNTEYFTDIFHTIILRYIYTLCGSALCVQTEILV